MTDSEILECFNESLREEARFAETCDYVAVEIPPGSRQVEFVETARQWVPLGAVLRCSIDDTGPDGEVMIYVDDVEFSLAEFGRLLSTYSGWGMRVCFVPEGQLAARPKIVLGEVD